MKKIFLIALAVVMVFTGTAFAAQSLTSGDQTIRGNKTFEHDAVFNKNVTILGALLGVTQYSSIFYVDSGSGADSPGNYGTTYLKPFATLDFAVSQTTASAGDIIFVMPGHNEGIIADSAIDLDVAGISVIGLGNGDNRPTIDFDHADATFVIGANNVTVENMRFRASANAITVGVEIEDGVTYATVRGCEFGDAETATDEFTISLQTNDASNNALIEYNHFDGGEQAAATAIGLTKDTDLTVIRGNWFTGTFTTAAITGATTASTNLLITDNHFWTVGTADTFNLVAASTGIVSRNVIVMNSISVATALDIGNALNFDNYLIADDDVGGAKSAITGATAASVTASADD